jgi:uncharacterized protein YggE
MKSAVVVPTALAIALLSIPASAQDTSPRPVITTAGEAILTRAPDRAFITVATDARAGRPDDARRMAAMAMTDVQTSLKAIGLATDAIRTVGFSLQPQLIWTDGKSSVSGFLAHNEIEVRVDDLDKLSAVLDAATTPKNVSLTIQGPRFDVKDREAVEHEALTAAVANAMGRAQAMADGAKLLLGPILNIGNETPETGGPMPMMMRSVAGAGGGGTPSTPVTPGTIEIRAAVRVTVAIRGSGGGR